jgi:phosphate starvation-inducible protein PhoH
MLWPLWSRAIAAHNLTIALGPAGTGKTYLAVSAAVDALISGVVARIVLTRPAVEAGYAVAPLVYERQTRALSAATRRCAQ